MKFVFNWILFFATLWCAPASSALLVTLTLDFKELEGLEREGLLKVRTFKTGEINTIYIFVSKTAPRFFRIGLSTTSSTDSCKQLLTTELSSGNPVRPGIKNKWKEFGGEEGNNWTWAKLSVADCALENTSLTFSSFYRTDPETVNIIYDVRCDHLLALLNAAKGK